MRRKGKKGQFFFVATLIIIAAIFSLTGTYNLAIMNFQQDSRYKFLAEELKSEGTQIIMNGYYNNQTFEEINSNIKNFTQAYSLAYTQYNITIVTGTGENSSKFNHSSFSKGENYNSDYQIIFQDNQVTLDLNSLMFNFSVSRGFNFHVIVIEENEKGRFVMSA